MKSNIVINAISLREGGSLIEVQQLLDRMARLRSDFQWHIITNNKAKPLLPEQKNIFFHIIPYHVFDGWKVRLWYEIAFLQLIKKIKADLLFSHTNYLPMRKVPCPTLLLVQNAGHFSKIHQRLAEAEMGNILARIIWRLKGQWVRSSVWRANLVTVQTRALAEEIIKQTGVTPNRICVIPHGTGHVNLGEYVPQTLCLGKPVRIGYITMYGVQKNFEVLFKAVANLKILGFSIVLILTLDPKIDKNRKVLLLADSLGISDLIENHGDLTQSQIDSLYKTLHIFVFPSLCESFGFPILEAMAHSLPLLVANTISNIEIVGDAALIFPSDNASILTSLIQRLINDSKFRENYSRASWERAKKFTWENAAVSTIQQIENLLLRS